VIDRFFDFSGRMGRLAYFGWSVLFTAILTFLEYVGDYLHSFGHAHGSEIVIILALILFLLSTVLALWAGASVAVKRLHDMNLPGYHMIWIMGLYVGWPILVMVSLPIVAIVDKLLLLIPLVVLLFVPGTKGSNKYD
jgi:uncharacterized membrane protein YhaH (DUF805 family)